MRWIFTAFSLFLVTSAAAAVELKLPTPEIEKLPNGMEVVWFLNDRIPVIDVAMLIKSGYRDDPQGKTGTAALVSRLLDRGAGGWDAQTIARKSDRLGASRYSTADDDTFTVGVHGLAIDAVPLLDLMSKMVIQPSFLQEEFSREHARMKSQWSHIEDSASTLVTLAFQRVIHAGTIYGRGGFLSLREFDQVQREDVVKFHQSHFTPANSILLVVGQVDQKSFRKKIHEKFGQWKGTVPPRNWVKFSDPRVVSPLGEVVVVDRPGLTQAQIRMGFPTADIRSPRRHAFQVLNALVGGYFNSRLNSRVRDELGLTYSIGSTIAYSKKAANYSIFSSTTNENVGKVIQETLAVLSTLKKPGNIQAAEVETAKDYLVGGFPLGVSTLEAVATRWVNGYFFDLGANYLNEFMPMVSKVDSAAVSEVLQKDFNLGQLVTVIAGDASKIVPQLQSIGIKKVKRLKSQQLL